MQIGLMFSGSLLPNFEPVLAQGVFYNNPYAKLI
jgi:hypothetical protein